MTGNDQRAQPVDAILQHHRASRDDAAHQAHGDALAEQLPVKVAAHPEMLFFRKQDLHSEEDVQDAEHHRNALRDDRCHSRPLHPHAHSCNEQEIQHHIQARGDEQEHQRHHAVANGAQQARAEVIGEHDQHAQINGQNVAVRIVQDLRRGVQHEEQRVQAQHTRQRNAKGSHQTDDQ